MRASPWCAAMALLLAGNALAARPHHNGDRHRVVSGWSVEQHAEDDGGYVVALRREAGPIHIHYTAAFWRGNDGRIQTIMVERGDCGNGDEIGRHVVLRATAIVSGMKANKAARRIRRARPMTRR